MAKIVFDADGSRRYENGCSRVVCYPKTVTAGVVSFKNGFVFDGATEMSENPGGADANDIYADNIKYGSMRSAETFGATLGAYQYPPEFAILDGTKRVGGGLFLGQQKREAFGMTYRTEVGNDANPEAGYKLHLVYNCTASPSSKSYSTVNESPDAVTFSWEISTTPIAVTVDSTSAASGSKPVATITIDTTLCTEAELTVVAALEDLLYGTETAEPKLPLPGEVVAMFEAAAA